MVVDIHKLWLESMTGNHSSSTRVQCSKCGEIQTYFTYGGEFFCCNCEQNKIIEYREKHPAEPERVFQKRYGNNKEEPTNDTV